MHSMNISTTDHLHLICSRYGFVVGQACFCVEPTSENLCPDDVSTVPGGLMYANSETSFNEYKINVTHNEYCK